MQSVTTLLLTLLTVMTVKSVSHPCSPVMVFEPGDLSIFVDL